MDTLNISIGVVVTLVIVALLFDFMNGFHDAANSIATIVSNYIVFGALIGAIIWNIITWYYGIPSSSSHALIGGLLGAAIAKVGFVGLIMTVSGKSLPSFSLRHSLVS